MSLSVKSIEKKANEDFVYIPVNQIVAPLFFRVNNDREYLEESVKEHGVITPIVVRRLENGKYRLIAGHGRFQVAKRLGIKKIPARIIHVSSDIEEIILSLEENINRKDLSVADLYNGMVELKKRRLSNDEIIKKLKISKSTLYRLLWLQEFSESVRNMFLDEEIPLRAADFVHQIQQMQPELLDRLPQHLSKIDSEKRAKILEQIVRDLKRKEEAKQAKLEFEELEEIEKDVEKEEDPRIAKIKKYKNLLQKLTKEELERITKKFITYLTGTTEWTQWLHYLEHWDNWIGMFVVPGRDEHIIYIPMSDSMNRVTGYTFEKELKEALGDDVTVEYREFLYPPQQEPPDTYLWKIVNKGIVEVTHTAIWVGKIVLRSSYNLVIESYTSKISDLLNQIEIDPKLTRGYTLETLPVREKILDVLAETMFGGAYNFPLDEFLQYIESVSAKREEKSEEQEVETEKIGEEKEETSKVKPITPAKYDTLIEHLSQFSQLLEYKKVPAEIREEIEYHIQQILILLEGVK